MSWYHPVPTGQRITYRYIPKVELHRHLEGSIRLETLQEIAEEHQLTFPVPNLERLVQIQSNEPLTFQNFLSKFQTLRMFYRSPEIIQRITEEAIADAASDGVRYMEMRFTPVALSRLQGFSLSEVIDWVVTATRSASEIYEMPTRLIVSTNRHEPVELALEVARLAAERKEDIVGLDLAGNEAEFSAEPFRPVFDLAREAGLNLCIHAGEWGPAANVRQAILLGAQRIGHGVRVLEDPETVALARDRGVVFEVCLTSNIQSGVFSTLERHPIGDMLQAGLKVTLHTDDPGISKITLSDEYRIFVEELGLPHVVLADCVLTAANAAFLPESRRQALSADVSQGLSDWLRC